MNRIRIEIAARWFCMKIHARQFRARIIHNINR